MRFPNVHSRLLIGPLLAAACGMTQVGCDGRLSKFGSDPKREATEIANARQKAESQAQVVAQGQLQPLGGVLSVMAPPGDRVARVAVSEGETVAKGDLLVELESLRAKTIELDVAEMKLAEGKARLEAEEAAANARLRVAQMKLEQAQTQLEQSREKLRIAEGPGGSLDLLRRAAELGERKLDRLRTASDNPNMQRLVSENKLEEESLKISETRAQYEAARVDARNAIETAELAVEAAKQDIVAAEKSIAAARASASLGSLEKQIQLLRLNIETAKLISPTAGRILKLDTMTGQATTTMPLLHMADTSQMVCIAEVNVADLRRIEVGQTAEITSPGLSDKLTGTVRRINQMIASPTMPSPFPMEPVDRHTAEVTIQIAPKDNAAAAERIHMQVEITIFAQPITPAVSASPPATTTDDATST
ncbi:HlyD family efflux transporter periplasmic adaptor subunit [Aporhodopirellula aestuarii]|uniref:Efflux RND transporter periplasmic adaptor subunit n=1 Tax=Aporhodopirellula aestuarii TaxID=2950107 RepID=A0ABT0TX04_9BACT|nr:HlyD family efflux transporter periplasmic adaptor subunit [Aporhodopirellula aestuarii]MCM2369142.1 efflux RND transporter periplasmic adaptor subunit [Aporhodopirellula aestuarii]